MFIQQAYQHLQAALSDIYSTGETSAIADAVIGKITGYTRIERIANKQLSLSKQQKDLLELYLQQLLQKKPLQYITNEAWFYGIKFFVNESVLIPRPETEELVDWIIKDNSSSSNKNILDIGTGSGCIPIALKKNTTATTVQSIDVSKEALQVAKQNASNLKAEIDFIELNFLNEGNWIQFSQFDIIVSNPPYISEREKENIEDNVLLHEPHLALFVSDNDPLIFYKKIADFGLVHLKNNGVIYVELNQQLAEETEKIFNNKKYKTELRKDINSNYRMLKAML